MGFLSSSDSFFFCFLISRSRFYDLQVRIKIWMELRGNKIEKDQYSFRKERCAVDSKGSRAKDVCEYHSAHLVTQFFFLARRVGVIMHAM